MPWRIQVITYDTPALSSTTGSSDGMTIPTRFRGDMLATTAAKCDDGSNAGPADWADFQQGDASFTAYTDDAIKLTPDFVNSLRDGSRVTLTFHFCRGDVPRHQVGRLGARHGRNGPVDLNARRSSGSSRLKPATTP